MEIKINENGPILIEVSEAKVIRDGTEETISQKTIALCRCGQSSNKPFCDGSHRKCEFKGELAEIELQ